jgi:Anti-sigma factor NepR
VNYSFYDTAEHPLTKRGDQGESALGGSASGNTPKRETAAAPQPAWAKGLQRLYDQVVEEQLPDDLAQLLDKLDRASDGH